MSLHVFYMSEIQPAVIDDVAICTEKCPSWRGVCRDNKPPCLQGASVRPGEECLIWYKARIIQLKAEGLQIKREDLKNKEFWREAFETDEEGTREIYRTLVTCFSVPEDPPDPVCAFPGCYTLARNACGHVCDGCYARFCVEHIGYHETTRKNLCNLCQRWENSTMPMIQYSKLQAVWSNSNDLVSILNTWGMRGWKLIDIETETREDDHVNCSQVLYMRSRT